jgi:hypothetical protein
LAAAGLALAVLPIAAVSRGSASDAQRSSTPDSLPPPVVLLPEALELVGCCDEPEAYQFTALNAAGYDLSLTMSYTVVEGAGSCSGPAMVAVTNGGSTPFIVELRPAGEVGDITVCEIGAVDSTNPANHDESQLIVHVTHFVWDPAGWQSETVSGASPTMWASCAAGWDPAAGRQVGYYVGGLDAAGEVQPLLQVFDPALGAWTQLPPPPDPMFSQVASVIGGKLYVSGGFHYGFAGSTNLQVFDPGIGTWDDIGYPDIPTPSGGLGGGAGGAGTCHTGSGLCHFHVGGGMSDWDLNLETWEFSPATNAWTRLDDRPPCPSLQGFAFGGGVGCRGYVFVGGNLVTNHDFHRLEPTAPAGSQWVQLEDIPGGCGAYSPTMVCNEAEGAVYVIGGEMDAGNMSGVACRYDIAADSWTVLPLYHEGFLGPCGVKMAGRIWTFGGARDVYALDPPPHGSLAQIFCAEGLPFADGFESGDTSAWWMTVP